MKTFKEIIHYKNKTLLNYSFNLFKIIEILKNPYTNFRFEFYFLFKIFVNFNSSSLKSNIKMLFIFLSYSKIVFLLHHNID